MVHVYPDRRDATGRWTAPIDRPYRGVEPMFAGYEPPQRSCPGCHARGGLCQLMGRLCAAASR